MLEEQPTIHHYHPTTGKYLESGVADPSPLEPGQHLIPAHATKTPPPAPQPNQDRVWNGETWQYVAIPEPEPEPETEPEPERKWGELAQRMNANIDWLRLVKSNGAAAELARYVSLQDVSNARAYWVFLDSEGDLSPDLKSAIEAAAAVCNLSDLFALITGEPP